MHQLIPFADRLIGQETVPMVDGKDLYLFLEVRRQYSDWIKDQIERGQFIENRDFIVYHNNVKNPQGGRPTHDCYLTFDTVKHIGMMSRTSKGIEVREYFIACEKELREMKYPDEPVNSTMDIIKRLHEDQGRLIKGMYDEQGLIIQEVDRNKHIVTGLTHELARLDERKLNKEDFERHVLQQRALAEQRKWHAERQFADWVKQWHWKKSGGRCLNPACRRELNPDPKAPRITRPQYDHVLSKEDGGLGGVDNCQVLCAGCNQNKRGMYVDYRPEDLRKEANDLAEERRQERDREEEKRRRQQDFGFDL